MRHVSLLDAFNAAANLTQQTLQPLTKEKEYELETELYKQSIELSTLQNELINDYTRIDPVNKNRYQENPEDYQAYVDKRLEEWRGNAEKAGNGSRYYMERLDRLDAEGRLAMGQRYKAAIVEVEQHRVKAAEERAITATRNRTDLPPAAAATQELQIKEAAAGQNLGDIPDNHTKTADTVNAYFPRALAVDLAKLAGENGIIDVQAAVGMVDRQAQEYLEGIQKSLPEGNSPDEYIADKNGTLEKARRAITVAAQAANFKRANAAHGDYLLAVQKFQENPNAEAGLRVQQLQEAGAAWRDKTRDSGNFSDEDKAKMVGWYQLPKEFMEEGKGGQPNDSDIANLMQILVNDTAAGTYKDSAGNVLTLYDLDESRFQAVWKKLTDEQRAYFGNDILQFKKEYAGTTLDSIQSYINKRNENYPGSAYTINNMKDLVKDIKDPGAGAILLSFMNDLYYSVQHNTYTEKEFRDKVNLVKDIVKAGQLKEVSKARAGDENSIAAAAAELLAKQEAIFTGTDQKVRFLPGSFETQITDYAKEEQALLANVLGIDSGQLMHNWRAEEGQRYDVMGLGEYQVLDETGNKTGAYVRMRPEATDRKLWEFWKPKYRPVYEYKEAPNGEWKPFTPEKRPSAFAQIGQQRLDDHEEISKIAMFSTANPSGIDAETWAAYPHDAKIGVIEDHLKGLKNPNREHIPDEQWNSMSPDQKREAIFAYFRGGFTGDL